MADKQIAKSTRNAPVLWLATEQAGQPFLHSCDGECECYLCESKKPSSIILIQ